MSIKEENLIPYDGEIKAGQRLMKIGNTFMPIGIGGAFEPAGIKVKEVGYDTFYKCNAVTETTWNGYALILGEDGYYTVSETLTEGLSFGTGYTPEVGTVYNANATIKVGKYWDGNILLDEHTVFLLDKSLTDSSGNNIPVTNHGLTMSDTGIVCTQNGYAEIPAYSLPDSVMCDNKEWTVEIRFRCLDVNAIPEIKCCLFGNGNDYETRFDVIVDSAYVGIGSYNGTTMSPNIKNNMWYDLKFTHNTNNDNTLYFDGVQKSENLSGKNIRGASLYIGIDGYFSDPRYGYPFEIEYIRISDIVR